ncbi:Uncharacterised protein (plasmid) [Legionella adelaidensis]|uniref:Uncharacterized protein n=1 Tax=Legionella adelaidensis TaxID=45056 RepID=A0A0W0R170_9GAMM|nr:hypothetical protein [Legionella adelaidensis]KTC64750.1 hypothetical protein Lade_2044 [Legionella adelaidensis]VEH81301.1 Uncharacterised protein [Legionella adelaidensis]
MEHIAEKDLLKVKDLLRRTGEFIAYFEIAEAKMIEWRQAVELHARDHQQQFNQQFQALRTEMEALQELLTEAGLARFRLSADSALRQGKEYLESMQKTEQQFLKHLTTHQRDLSILTKQAIEQIAFQTNESLQKVSEYFAHYDVQHFNRIANESCEQVERSASHVINKCGKILRIFQWRSVTLTLLITVVTAFVMGLYMSNEYPWEIHERAMNERGAGKMLINAWPKLSYHEKIKILGEQSKSS